MPAAVHYPTGPHSCAVVTPAVLVTWVLGPWDRPVLHARAAPSITHSHHDTRSPLPVATASAPTRHFGCSSDDRRHAYGMCGLQGLPADQHTPPSRLGCADSAVCALTHSLTYHQALLGALTGHQQPAPAIIGSQLCPAPLHDPTTNRASAYTPKRQCLFQRDALVKTQASATATTKRQQHQSSHSNNARQPKMSSTRPNSKPPPQVNASICHSPAGYRAPIPHNLPYLPLTPQQASQPG